MNKWLGVALVLSLALCGYAYSLLGRIEALESERAELIEKVATAEAYHQAVEQEFENFEGLIDDVRSNLGVGYGDRYEDLVDAIDSATSSVDDLETALDTAQTALDSLGESLEYATALDLVEPF